jgi:protoporphyrinogen IX oxidase
MMNWFIVFHVFGVIFWVGSLLLISSLLGLAADEVGAARETLIVAGRRLFRVSANAGALVTVIFGIGIIALQPAFLTHGWLHVKLLLVVGLLACHLWLYRRVGALENDPGSASRRAFVMIHGVVSLLVLAILGLVFFQPF